MSKKILFLVLNFWAVALFAGDSTQVSLTDTTKSDTAYTVMSGVFTVGEKNEVPQDGRIIVKDVKSGETIGIYTPNAETGKYLYILQAGKTYDITYEVSGSVYKSENLIIPTSTSYQKIKKKINLGW